MSNAAIYLDPEAYLTSGDVLMGRHSAGESFLRGFLRHGDVDGFRFWNVAARPLPELEAMVDALHGDARPRSWIGMRDRGRLGEAGAVYLPGPFVGREAWQRSPFGANAYSICGITHTTASAEIQADIGQLLVAPTQAHDALICTSEAVRAAVEAQLDAIRDYLAFQFGPRRTPEPQRVTIPLGINTADFARTDAQRATWRERLGIPADAVVALYVGRFSALGKMNPGVMALALEAAARETGREVWWVLSGWAEDAQAEARYHDGARTLCPSVRYVVVDGRPAETRFSIWSVADVFISLSDNVQETFGLTPLEAMAAGLPSVVSDWDGYRDTVRDNVDGFRIPTWAPSPGQGRDLAFGYANGWIDYSSYVGLAAQTTAVDIARAADAIAVLIRHPRIAREMGEAAQAHARTEFDWSVIIPRYQALWADLAARRAAAAPSPANPDNPWRMDPFRAFAGYATRHITAATQVVLSPGVTPASAIAVLKSPMASLVAYNFPTPDEVEAIVGRLSPEVPLTVSGLLADFPAGRRYFLERGLGWLAKFGVVRLA
ncbi:MAG: glycosyltransferase family 4 protein [Phenylobacterium sp.]|uniref:glycosyltransferase family 4 protein n=1 Tax=Phenylobacterium sp. TaxID=1871053 RepID=UPI002735A03E|nr:glycosyltransferase family 4 protein [Phenylobacterium sp.]MDP3173765.1 glycosyltransferase family 4 protein [Phenylobacterium sp.]